MKKSILLIVLSLAITGSLFAQYAPRPADAGAGAGTGDALVADPLSQFAATTSAEFKGVINDENAPDGASSKVIMALGSLSIASGKTATISKTLTLTGTDGTTMTFPATSATVARTDAANTFTGHQTIEGVTSTGATGTGNFVFDISPTLITPTIGVATATSINKMAITAPATGSTLAVAEGKTFTASKTLTLDGTDGTTMTFPTTSATVARTDAANTFTGHQTIEGVTSTGATGTGALVFGTSPTLASPVLTTPNLGTPSALTLTSAIGLPISGLTASTSTALGVGSIELGAASDTTIARSGAGAITVEGTAVLLSGGALGTPSSGTLTNATGLPVAGITASTSTALGVGSIELGAASDTTIARSGAGAVTVEGVGVVTTSSTDTLTNKRFTPRVTTIVSNATPTVNTDNTDAVTITALAAAITSMTTNLSGAPNNFDKLIFRIKDDGTARAITWGASFEAKGVALPTTTVLSKVLTVGFIYDSVSLKWGCVAALSEA